MSKEIEIKFKVHTKDNRVVLDKVNISADFDKEKIGTNWEVSFISYLIRTMELHAPPIIFAAVTAADLATLKAENIQYQDCCCD